MFIIFLFINVSIHMYVVRSGNLMANNFKLGMFNGVEGKHQSTSPRFCGARQEVAPAKAIKCGLSWSVSFLF